MARTQIGTKLGLGFGIILINMCLVMTISLWKLGGISEQSHRITQLRAPTVQASSQLENGIYKSQAALGNWMSLGENKFKVERHQSWSTIRSSVRKLDELSQSWTNPKNVARLKKVNNLLDAFEINQREIEDIAQRQDNTPAVQLFISDAMPPASIISTQISLIIDAEKGQRVSPDRKDLFATMVDFRGSFSLILAYFQAFLISGDDRNRQKFEDIWHANKLYLQDLIKRKRQLISSQRDALEIIIKRRLEFAPLSQRLFALRSGQDWNRANYLLQTNVAPAGEELKRLLQEMVADQQGLLQEGGAKIQNDIYVFSNLLWALFASSIVASIGISIYITRNITAPIHQAVQLAGHVAKGEFGDVCSMRSSHFSTLETDHLLTSLNTMSGNLYDMVNEIRAGEAHIKAIVDTATDAIITFNNRGIIQSANASTSKIFKYSEDDLIGMDIRLLMPETNVNPKASARNDCFKSKSSEMIGRTQDGTEKPLFVSTSNIVSADKILSCEIIRDLTKEKEAQSRMLRSERLNALGNMVSGIAHEMNTPIGIGVANISQMVDEIDAFNRAVNDGGIKKSQLIQFLADTKTFSDVTLENLLQAAKLIQNFKQIGVVYDDESPSEICMYDLIQDTMAHMRFALDKADINVTVDCAQDLTLKTVPTVITQILTSLIENSRVHGFNQGHDAGTINIIVKKVLDDHVVTLTYVDSGQGLSAEHQKNIFDPFFTTSRNLGGSGLGMHIVHNLVTENLGGTISVGSNVPQGLYYIIRLPL